MKYEFTLYGGAECSKLLVQILVRGVPDSVPTTSVESMLASPGACGIRHGAYAGSDPFNSDEAWSCLGAAQAQGAQYLIIPAKSFWWLDRYHKFREHVEARYPAIVRDESACIVFELHESLAVSPPIPEATLGPSEL